MSLSAQVTAAGISAPSYTDILLSLQGSFRAIYGADAYIDPDSQDGQFLALIASAISDCNDTAVPVFNAFSPSYAQGSHLSALVKLNGLQRLVASRSTAPYKVTGTAGTTITNGVTIDENGNAWTLPVSVVIPPAGEIIVTVTAKDEGDITAASGTINKIGTPTLGWQSGVSTADATPGAPIETDASLRRRQTVSVALPSQSTAGGLLAALSNLDGVQRVKLYENYTLATDGNGLPAKSISAVIDGGSVSEIAQTIGQKKTIGAGTYGSTSQEYADPLTDIPYTINFFVLADSAIKLNITLTARAGYTTAIGTAIKQSIAAYINERGIGEAVEYSRLWAPAYLSGGIDGTKYEITAMTVAKDAGAFGTADLSIDFNKAAHCDISDITITVA